MFQAGPDHTAPSLPQRIGFSSLPPGHANLRAPAPGPPPHELPAPPCPNNVVRNGHAWTWSGRDDTPRAESSPSPKMSAPVRVPPIHSENPQAVSGILPPSTAPPRVFPPAFGLSAIQTPFLLNAPDIQTPSVRSTGNGTAPPANEWPHPLETPSTLCRRDPAQRFAGNLFQHRHEMFTHALNARRFQFLHPRRALVPAVRLFHKFFADAEKLRAH